MPAWFGSAMLRDRPGWRLGRWPVGWAWITWAVMMRLVQVVAQEVGPGRVAEFGHGLGLDLADPLPGHAVHLADLIQRLGLAVGQPEPHRDHPRLPLRQRVQHRMQLLLQQRETDRLTRLDRLAVLDQVTELAIAVLTQRSMQRNRLP